MEKNFFTSFFDPEQGPVPAVDPADIRRLWDFFSKSSSSFSAAGTAIDMRLYEKACSPGADVVAVWYRVAMLQLLARVNPQFAERLHGDEVRNAASLVAARFPMERMRIGAPRSGPPFEVSEFLRQVEEELGK